MLGYIYIPFSHKGFADSRSHVSHGMGYSHNLDNLIISGMGVGENRQVINQILVSAFPNRVSSIHEHINAIGSSTYYAGANGQLFTITVASGAISQPVTATAPSGYDAARRIRSVQMGNRMIFYNGTNRPFWTENGTTFEEQRALTGFGSATGITSALSLLDNGIVNWILEPIAVNDIVYNRTENGFGVITAITTGRVDHTAISSAATGIGIITNISSAGHAYEIIDTVALNVIPADGPLNDNVGLAGVATGAGQITVSGMTNWFATEVRVGDYVRNPTRSAITQVTAIASATLGVNGITGQVCGDSLLFLKGAMPIPFFSHIFFDRMYSIDARDRSKIRVSTKDDPSDYTTAGGTLESMTIAAGNMAADAERFLQITSFRDNIVFGGEKNIIMFTGGDPIADVSGAAIDFKISTIIPSGIVSQDSMTPVGNVLLFVSRDGVQAAGYQITQQIAVSNITEQLAATTQADLNQALTVSAGRVRLVNYPRRQLAILKARTTANRVLNYTIQSQYRGKATEASYIMGGRATWTTFTGQMAGTDAEMVDSQGRFLVAYQSASVDFIGEFDAIRQTSAATPDRALNNMTWGVPEISLSDESGKGFSPYVHHGKFIQLHCETMSGNNPTVTIEVENELASSASVADSVSFTVGPTGTEENNLETIMKIATVIPPNSGRKFPLRWRGSEVEFETTVSGLSPFGFKGLGVWATKKGRN
mgnify:CR=1 FL=1